MPDGPVLQAEDACARPVAPMTQRRIPLEGQPNFRDLGGYPSADGRTVRRGALYRSGELSKLSESDRAQLAALQLKTVVDLRSEAEVSFFGESPLPAGVDVVQIPVASGNLVAEIIPPLLEGDFSKVPPDLLIRVNRQLAKDAASDFAQFMRIVAEPSKRPLVFHCTQGKDRTGFAAALVLSALGVSWDDIVDDYMLSNPYRETENERYLEMIAATAAQARGVPVEDLDLSVIRALFFVEPAAINAARDQMVQDYGSVEAYLDEALGFGELAQSQLRTELLER